MASILVIGAGELGTQVIRHLARIRPPGTTITVLLRATTIDSPASREKRAEIDEFRSLGIQFLKGDVVGCPTSELVRLFGPFETVINCMGFAAGKNIQLKITDAVLEANVARYVPWQFGVDYDVIGRGSAQNLFDLQLDVRDRLRSQDSTDWVIISTGMFTSFLFESAFGVVDLKQGIVRALGSWGTAVTVTTSEDIGALTAEILYSETPRYRNEIVYTAGETLTYERLASIVQKVLGRDVERTLWDLPYLESDLKDDSDNAIKKYRVVFAAGQGVSWDIRKTFNWQRGRWTTDVESWLRNKLTKPL